jgi:aminopeptidase N
VWDLLVNGDVTAAEAARCVTSVLARETGDTVIEPYLDLAIEAAELWAPEARRAELAAAVADVSRLLAREPGRRQLALRAFARSAADLDDLAWLREQAGDDVDLHWRALVREAELGETGTGDARIADELARLRERDPDPDSWLRELTVRAAMPNAEAKEAVWQKVAVEHAVPIGVVRTIMAAFWRPGQDAVLAPYAQRYLDLIPELDVGGMIPAMVQTSQLMPLYAIDESYLETALAAADQAAPVVRKTITERVDLIRRMLRARSQA